jgi:micrococcal nuclease
MSVRKRLGPLLRTFRAIIILAAVCVAATVAGIAQRPDMTPAFARLASITQPLEVVDGDTVKRGSVRTRLLNLDTPEPGSRAKCPEERELAARARARLKDLIKGGNWQMIWSKRHEKYVRDLTVLTIDGQDVAAIMIAEGLARPYTGRKKRRGWCGADITP